MSSPSFDDVISKASHEAVRLVAPSEKDLLCAVLAGPGRRFARNRGPVAFGLDDAANWASGAVVSLAIWYSEIWIDAGKSAIEKKTRSFIKGVRKNRRGELPAPPDVSSASSRPAGVPIDAAEREEHIHRARRYLVALEMDEVRAEVAAIAVVDSVLQSIGRAT